METLKASQFDWDKEKRTMSAEISELRLDGFPNQLMISSTKTESKFMFESIQIKRDREGDIQFIEYAPLQTQSALADIRIFIYND